MKRVILDTNIYGLLATDEDRLKIIDKLKNTNKLIVYGFKIVRNELRDIPASLKIQNKSLRIDLLNLYDAIVEEHNLDFDISLQGIANNYYLAYRELGGIKLRENILTDFMIVSAASLNNLDIVVSNDEKSMLTENAIRAYNLVNSVINKKTPKFMVYRELKKLLRGASNEFV